MAIRHLFPIAIDRVRDASTSRFGGILATRIRKQLKHFFNWGEFFHVVSFKKTPPASKLEGMGITTIDFQAWHDSGAYGLIKAELLADPGGGLRSLLLRFYVTETGEELKTAGAVIEWSHDSAANLRAALAQYVDGLIIRFTGNGGSLTTRIAYTKGKGRFGSKDVFVMNSDGTGAAAITNNGSINMLPAWTRDGQVSYTSYINNNPDLFVGKRKLSARPRMNMGASFHPDGRQAVLTLSKDGNAEIYVIDAQNGRILRRLTRNRSIDTSPAWSRNGARIAFVSNRSGGVPKIFVMRANGTRQKLINQVGAYNTSPKWSPVRDELVYASLVGGNRFDIYSVDMKSRKIRRLTRKGSNIRPSFSPDGRYIVFSRRTGRVSHLWRMRADGSHKRRLTEGPGYFSSPAWQPRQRTRR